MKDYDEKDIDDIPKKPVVYKIHPGWFQQIVSHGSKKSAKNKKSGNSTHEPFIEISDG